jgi:hypothetical protein
VAGEQQQQQQQHHMVAFQESRSPIHQQLVSKSPLAVAISGQTQEVSSTPVDSRVWL